MKPKVLFIATVYRMHVQVFHLPYMRWFQQQGYEVHLCCSNDTDDPNLMPPYCDRFWDLPFARSPFSKRNLSVYRQLKELIDREAYTLIHCNTPVGGMLGRLCARDARKKGTRVVYTAHGFHFFSGAPWANWLMFYPAERFLARYTDLLITINREDYARAQRFPARQTSLVSGVGVDLSRFEEPSDRAAVRRELGIAPEAPALICVGEHSERKNHLIVLKAAAQLPGVHVLFCGVGEKQPELEAYVREQNMTGRVHFLGFRTDIPKLLDASDVFVFPSLQEGLPVSLMEAMAAGLPCVVSKVRGNADLIRSGEGGFLRAPYDFEGMAQDIRTLLEDPALRERMGYRNREEMQLYSLETVLEQMTALYRQQLQ
jgi:glycosyltransferase EpsD